MSKSLDQKWEIGISNAISAQESKALKDALTDNDIAKIVSNVNVLPISEMKDNEKYSDRFEGHRYNPMMLKNEIRILDAKQGGNMWLLGERFSEIKKYKLYTQWGYDSFDEFIEKDTKYSRSTVYAYIGIYARYEYKDAVSHGSKLQLIPAYFTEGDEKRVQTVLTNISDMAFDEAKAYISELKSGKAADESASDDDKVVHMVPSHKSSASVEPYLPSWSKITPEKVSRDGKVVIDKSIVSAVKPYNVIYSWEKKQDKQIFEEVLDEMWKTILRRMADKKLNR